MGCSLCDQLARQKTNKHWYQPTIAGLLSSTDPATKNSNNLLTNDHYLRWWTSNYYLKSRRTTKYLIANCSHDGVHYFLQQRRHWQSLEGFCRHHKMNRQLNIISHEFEFKRTGAPFGCGWEATVNVTMEVCEAGSRSMPTFQRHAQTQQVIYHGDVPCSLTSKAWRPGP